MNSAGFTTMDFAGTELGCELCSSGLAGRLLALPRHVSRRLPPARSVQHRDQRRASILAVARPLHLVVLRPLSSLDDGELGTRRGSAWLLRQSEGNARFLPLPVIVGLHLSLKAVVERVQFRLKLFALRMIGLGG